MKYTEHFNKFKSQFNLEQGKQPIQYNKVYTKNFKDNEEYLLSNVNKSSYKYIKDYISGSGIYCIEFENCIKFGITTNFNRRLGNYRTPNSSKIENIYFLKTNYKGIKRIEDYLKKKYKSDIIEGTREYLDRESLDYIKVVKSIHNSLFKTISNKRIYGN